MGRRAFVKSSAAGALALTIDWPRLALAVEVAGPVRLRSAVPRPIET
jgi:hypothetical protein